MPLEPTEAIRTVHLLVHGFAACGAGAPTSWPEGDFWTDSEADPRMVTCTSCQAARSPQPLEGNPLLRVWLELYPEGAPFDSRRRWASRRDDFRSLGDALIRRHAARKTNAQRYAWAVPTDDALAAIARHGPLVEIGAGTGYWAALLARRGVDVVAYDAAPPPAANHWHPGAACWVAVEQGGPEKVDLHPDRALFLCWPPYADPMAADALRRYAGRTVIYVGEGGGGCTGDEAFHDQLERDFEEVELVAIPQWEGVHDYLSIHARK